MTEQIGTVPQMGASAADSWRYRDVPAEILNAQADRIAELDSAIWNSPDAYLDAVTYLGGITLSEEEQTSESYTSADIGIPNRLRSFLDSGDDTRVEFDEASDEAIYGNEEVIARLSYHKSRLGVRHRSTGRDQTETYDHPEAADHLDQLTLYKLYLYIGRVRAYKAQSITEVKGSDQSAA